MKQFLVTFFLFVFSFTVFAQSDNLCPESSVPTLPINACAGPTAYNIPTSHTIDPAASVAVGTTCVVAAQNFRDGWYKFTANATSTTLIATVIAARNVALTVYTGSCGSMTEVGCQSVGGNGVTETLVLATTIGTTYYVRIIKTGNATGAMTGTISVLTPAANDDCSGYVGLTPSAPAGPCSQTCGTTYGTSSSSPTSACAGSANDDVWYRFTATQAQHQITVAGSSGFNAVVEVLSGSCGSLVSLGCANATAAGGTENLLYTGFNPGSNYYIRVYDNAAGQPTTYEFSICVTSPVLPTCPGSMGGGVVNVASLPYSSSGRTTAGKGDDFTAANVTTCGSTTYFQGLDEVFIFTPSSSGNISVTLTSGSTNVGIMLYDDCPFAGSGASCVAFSQSSSGNQSFCTNVTSGTQYYLVVDRNNAGGNIPSYNIIITDPASGSSGATCATAVNIGALPYSISNQTTLCKGDDYDNSSNGSCNSLYESGEDMVFSYTAGSAQCINVTLSNTSDNEAGVTVYQNCPGTGSANCLGFIGGGNVSTNITLPAAGTYYIVVDSWNPPSFINFDLDITAGTGSSPNDYPCSATTLPLGSTLPGDNRCSNGLLEPAVPSCWTSGNVNTVWYAVTPTGTSLNIRTILGTLTNTQIALYRNTCSSLTQVTPTASSCNTDETSCGAGTTLNSQMTVTGLTAGQQYFIRVDGENNLTGTFSITAVDGGGTLPFINGQDCGQPLTVCPSTSVATSYSGNGNYCDFPSGSNCLTSGESNSVWYRLPINSSGSLTFDIIPNDWPGSPSTSGTDYDFAIWEVGASGLTCADLATNSPDACNNNTLGLTGCAPSGNAPATYPGFNSAYETPIGVSNGQIYLLAITNNTGNSQGFTLNISSSPDPVNYTGAPASLTWNGSSNTNFAIGANWGSCFLPTCSIDATIPAAPGNQPTVTNSQTVKNITIAAGATLTINPGVVLSVCGNFVNNGNFRPQVGSIVRFIGGGAQSVSGNLTGLNAFANFTVAKGGGTLTLSANIDISESDSLLSGLLNTNARTIKIKKDLYNANGTATHISPAAGSTYEFNGSGPQNYVNIGSDIDFNNVTMNQSVTSSLTLGTGGNNNMNIQGILNLTRGKIVTGAREVIEKNPATASITSYTANSYVEGNLRRYLNANATGIYDFPVGHSAKGYELARVNFTAATQIPQLVASFNTWGAVPVGPVSSECTFANYSLNPALDHGYWTINASANPNTGTYTMTLFNQNYTNPLSGWTVMKRTPSGSGVWALNGTCVVTSTAAITQRTAMSGFSDFATAQSASPLPIELLRFDAVAKNSGVLTSWETASEINNEYFDVERSTDGYNFERRGIVEGSGTTTINHSYSFLDSDPGVGLFYYRLKQVDHDGKFSFSDIVAVKVTGTVDAINIYPNPANSMINFEFESSYNTKVKLQIVNMLGKILREESMEVRKGIFNSQVDIKDLPEGVYYLKIFESDAVYKGRFVKIE